MSRIDDFLNSFPQLKKDMEEHLGEYAMKDMLATLFEQKARGMYTRHVREEIAWIKNAYKGKNIKLAWLDVARYQTDVWDAAVEWDVEEEVLSCLLRIKPPPVDVDERLRLEVPKELRRKRELR